MKRRTAHLVGYTAGYGLLLLLERAQATLERQQAERLAEEAHKRAEAVAEVLVQALRTQALEEELQAAVDLEAEAAAHRCTPEGCCP